VRGLLDVNVLIALLDENHAHHSTASEWFADHVEYGWASCPLTQNGCVRIVSQPRYPNALGVAEAVTRLEAAVSTSYHQFIADDVTLLDAAVVNRDRLLSPRQLTDVYLLALAIAHGARLVTLDKSVPFATVRGANKDSLVVI
jgi:toxin-antitoxin system PIN domain toxin